MTDLNIPTLDIEDFDPEIAEAQKPNGVEDESGGALTYAVIGSGQGGGRIAKAFYDLGYKKTVALNTAKSDLTLLNLPDEHKFYVDYYGDQGAGKIKKKLELLMSPEARKSLISCVRYLAKTLTGFLFASARLVELVVAVSIPLSILQNDISHM